MSTRALALVRFLTVFLAALAAGEILSGRQTDTFDFGWRFFRGDAPGAEQPGLSDAGWRALDLPHDWSIEGPYDENAATGGSGGYLPAGIGWYRKSFTLPESARGQCVRVDFDGIYQHATVWINGHELGTRPYGYIYQSYDLTPYVQFGPKPNLIAVRVDSSAQPSSRWYSGAGIFRHTWLTLTDPLHIAPSGVWITTPEISGEKAIVRVRTRVLNTAGAEKNFQVRLGIVGGAAPFATDPARLATNAEAETDGQLVVPAPRLWSPETPNLYRLRAEVLVEGAVVDAIETAFGVRSLEYNVDRGLLLNGRPVKLKGVCVHHDGGAVGAAVPEAVWERRLGLLREMGCNAIRCSHNPMAPEFYDLCDRLGFLVLDEAFDEWTVRKPQIKFGYSDAFNDWHERDLVDFIRHNRNHPSIVMWSAGNEIGEQWAPRGPEILRDLVAIFHREDPTRPVTAAMDNIFNQHGQAPVAFSGLLDVVGYNYVDRWGARRETFYDEDRSRFPQRKFVGTESSTMRSVRGEYRFGPALGGGFGPKGIIPGYGPEVALYLDSSLEAAALWRFILTRDYVVGDFGWTGIDYLGESRWPRKLSTSGQLDTCGFKKDSFYFYQSIWTDKPMIHLLPHWNWPDRAGRVIPVVAYSNCAVVELFLNGQSLGAKAREFPAQGVTENWNHYPEPIVRSTTADFQFAWDVPYAPGELKAVGYDRKGVVVAGASVRTAGPATKLEVTVDRAAIVAGRRDVAHFTVRALDANGVFVPLADNPLTFELSGPAKLIGLDNGDPASHESYQGNTRHLYAGMALALVQAKSESGPIRLMVKSAGLAAATVEIKAVQP